MIQLLFISAALAAICKSLQHDIRKKLLLDYKFKLVRLHGLLDIGFVMFSLGALIFFYMMIKNM